MLQSREATEEEIKATGLVHRAYVPPEGSQGAPLVVLVHGRAGTAQVTWVFTKALEKLKPVVLTPQGTIPDIKDGWSWWPVRDKLSADASAALRAERLAEVEAGVIHVRDFIRAAQKLYGTDPARTYIAGFSQGGALSATLSLMEPEMFRGVGILSGFIPYAVLGEPGLVAGRVKDKSVPLPRYFISHGTKDDILPISRAAESKEWLEKAGADVTYCEEEVTHKVGSAGIKALGEWFENDFAAR